jgi:hypothetical protein
MRQFELKNIILRRSRDRQRSKRNSDQQCTKFHQTLPRADAPPPFVGVHGFVAYSYQTRA